MPAGESPHEPTAPRAPRAPRSRYRGARVFDCLCATIGVVLFAPLLATVSVAILIDDGRPLVFRQRRLGRGTRPFVIWKFRTMRDGSVTRTGRWLRATGLDETLQFINVLRGEMAMVGPRPLTRDDARRLGFDGLEHRNRWQQCPGITGVAQVLGTSSAMETREWENRYQRRASAPLDAGLVAASTMVNLVGKRRVRRLARAALWNP